MTKIEITGIEEVKAQLSHLSQSLTGEQMQRKMMTIGGMIQGSIEESFEEERSPFGQGWRPILTASAAAKAGRGGRSQILQDTGDLADHWQIQARPTEVTISNNTAKAYGAVHQYGSRKSSGRGSGIPARPFLPIDAGNRLEPRLASTILAYLSREIDKLR